MQCNIEMLLLVIDNCMLVRCLRLLVLCCWLLALRPARAKVNHTITALATDENLEMPVCTEKYLCKAWVLQMTFFPSPSTKSNTVVPLGIPFGRPHHEAHGPHATSPANYWFDFG